MAELKDTLYGSKADIENCAGYCFHHHKWLTVKQIKRKKCLSRAGHEYCHAFRKREEHPWWEQRRKK